MPKPHYAIITGVEIPEDTPVIEGLLIAQAHMNYSSSSGASSSSASASTSNVPQITSRADLWNTVHTVEYDLVAQSAPSTASQIELDVSAASKSWASGRPWVVYRAASGFERADAKESSNKDKTSLDSVQLPGDTKNMLKLCR
jgi:hypothetical protein